MTDSDPWSVKQPENDIINRKVVNGDNKSTLQKNSSGFEDSFIPPADNNNSHEHEGSNNSCNNKPEHQPLPDSQTYLKGLERKLDNLKKNSKLVDALSEKRNDCLRSLIQNDLSGSGCNNDLLLELETSIVNSDSAVHNLYRQLQPVQPITIGETVHIVKFDQLEEQRLEADEPVAEDEEPVSR